MYSKMTISKYIRDYWGKPVSDIPLKDRIEKLCEAIRSAECILVGAGSGLSTAAGIEYGGERFQRLFPDFIEKYHLSDMYSASFYQFPTEEERWAYMARHILVNRFDTPDTELFCQLKKLLDGKDYFVITTNVDGQFEKYGFPADRLFAVQGDYAYLQCADGCHDKLYYDEDLVRNMVAHTEDCRIPSGLVPRCPECGGAMEVHIRKDDRFVQDQQWYDAAAHYESFLNKALEAKTVLLEFGVGFNTPGIIRFPFEKYASSHDNVTLARFNKQSPDKILPIRSYLPFPEDIPSVLAGLLETTRQPTPQTTH